MVRVPAWIGESGARMRVPACIGPQPGKGVSFAVPRRAANGRALDPGIYSQLMKYKIALHKSEEGFSVSVPGLPGCWSQGETEEEALRNIQDAIREYLAAVDELLRDATVREVEVAV